MWRLENIGRYEGHHRSIRSVFNNSSAHPFLCSLFRYDILLGALISNLPLASLNDFAKSSLNKHTLKNLGDSRDLFRDFGTFVREGQFDAIIHFLDQQCFPQFGFTFDGSPTFANAEAVSINVCTKDYKLHDILVHVALFEGSLTGEELSLHLLHALEKKCKRSMSNARAAHCDRCAVNTKALRLIFDPKYAPVSRKPCNPHTLCKPGERFVCPEWDLFRSFLTLMFCHRGAKANVLFRKEFGESAKTGKGVRWHVKYEQAIQTLTIGLQPLLEKVVRVCVMKEYSKKSSLKLWLKATEDPVWLAKATIQLAAVADGGNKFVKWTYSLEGDDPLILTAYKAFAELDDIAMNGVSLRFIPVAAKEAMEILGKLLLTPEQKVKDCETSLQAAELCLETTEAEYKANRPQVQETRTGRKSGRKRRLAEDEDDSDLLEAEAANQIAMSTKRQCQLDLTAALAELEECKRSLPFQSEAEVIEYTLSSVIKPGIDYYKKHYLEEQGDLFKSKKAMEACRIFNPFELEKLPTATLELCADNLIYLDMPEISQDFIRLLKNEIPEAVKQAKQTFDWDTLKCEKGGFSYARRKLARTMRLKKIQALNALANESEPEEGNLDSSDEEELSEIEEGNAESEDEDEFAEENPTDTERSWKDDIGEMARRIWEWWKIRLNAKQFIYFGFALQHVGITKVSSAFIERVFSHMKTIVELCTSTQLEESLETRLMLRINGDFRDRVNVNGST
jgi:hypothetical protein